ncbi:MAG: allophanate hydrolase subunit 1 [Betaproteobacteria bacterium]|nr:allophanate hydrolase subunit 1 [Betaproteobacteria bacterium]
MPPHDSSPAPRVEACGDAWVMVDWFDHPQANTAARKLAALLRAEPQDFAAEAVAGVRTLAVRLRELPFNAPRGARAHVRNAALRWLEDRAGEVHAWALPEGREVVLPACYAAELAPDLEAVAEQTGLDTASVVARHLASSFVVEVVGFMPGFAYLGGLDPALRLPRRASPRPRVSEGSIAIAGTQSAVYPGSTPGGWHLIGRCPLRLFNPLRSPAAVLHEGDRVRFERIEPETFAQLWSRR